MLFASQKSILTVTIWGVVGPLGLLGGVVIAEQIEVTLATGEEKTQAYELALAGLAPSAQTGCPSHRCGAGQC